MNAKFRRAILAVAALLVMAGYNVQGQDIAVRGDVPFDFIVGDQLMKAGEYTIGQTLMPKGVLNVNGYETGDRAVRLAMNVDHRTLPARTVLIFNRYVENGGEVYTFLSQVWVEGMKTGRQFLKGRVEREAEARSATREIITLVVRRMDR